MATLELNGHGSESTNGLTHGGQDDVVIMIMGNTGTGKSSVIKLLSGDSRVKIGTSLESETRDVRPVPFLDSGRNVTIVDTPDFDNPHITDRDVLEKITNFLLTEYDKHQKLNGIIYFQRISDPRFGGQSSHNLEMFRNICGTKAFKNVVVLTTFWDQLVNRQAGEKREAQLKTIYFKDLVEGGAHFMRHDQTIESARDVLQYILTLVPTNVQIQEEIRLEGKILEDTAAGSVQRMEVKQIVAKEREKWHQEWKYDAKNEYQFDYSEQYPPYIKNIPQKYDMPFSEVFNLGALSQTMTILHAGSELPPEMRYMTPDPNAIYRVQDLANRDRQLHLMLRENSQGPNIYFRDNIGLRDDWYTDAVLGQQQFTGTNPTTIRLAPLEWINEFKTASQAQQRVDVTKLLTDDPANIFIQDYSDFRLATGIPRSSDFVSEGRYGCSSVALFHLEPEGRLHPLAITIDYKGSMESSVTIFNRCIISAALRDESEDWPWRYAKMCTQVSDWFRHEVGVHLVNTHLVEEVIIVAANRAFEPSHIIFELLEPHWRTTLPINKAARQTLVPGVIVGLIGLTAAQTYTLLMDAYNKFDWTNQYVPNDLRRRGFPIENLDNVKYHNYGYARDIACMWIIIRKFVSAVLTDAYVGGDEQVAKDSSIAAFHDIVRSQGGGRLASFPEINTLDGLIDVVTMCIHIASPQHTAVNYLQQYYQTFVPNKPSALYTPLPQTLEQLQNLKQGDILNALPIHKPRDWLLMAQVPYLLSSPVSDQCTILHFATTTADSSSTPGAIRNAAKSLRDDLEEFSKTVSRHSKELDDQTTPYLVLDPSRTATSILI